MTIEKSFTIVIRNKDGSLKRIKYLGDETLEEMVEEDLNQEIQEIESKIEEKKQDR